MRALRQAIVVAAAFGFAGIHQVAHAGDDPERWRPLLPPQCQPTPAIETAPLDPAPAIVQDLVDSDDPWRTLMTAAQLRAEQAQATLAAAQLEILRSTARTISDEPGARVVLALLLRLWRQGQSGAVVDYAELASDWPTIDDVGPEASEALVAAIAQGPGALIAVARYQAIHASPALPDAAALAAQAQALLWGALSGGDCAAIVTLAQLELEPIEGIPRVEHALWLLRQGAALGSEAAAIALSDLYLDPSLAAFDPVAAAGVLADAEPAGSDSLRLRLATLLLEGPLPAHDRPAGIALLRAIDQSSPFAADAALLLAQDAAGRFGGPQDLPSAEHYLRAAAMHADARVAPRLALARAYLEGWAGGLDSAAAEAIYAALADEGHASAMLGLGELMLLRDGPNAEAFALIRQAAERGSLAAIHRLLGLAVAGHTAGASVQEVRDLLARASFAGDGSAALALSRYLIGESILSDAPEMRNRAVDALEAAVRAGNVEAMLELARAYEIGLAGVVDVARSAQLHEAALRTGTNTTGTMLDLARAYLGSTGLGPRPSRALEWLRRCAAFGEPRCYEVIGALGRSGQGSALLAPAEAENALRAVAMTGSALAMFELALMLEDRGQSDEAQLWRERAAERGHIPAMLAMASVLRHEPANLAAAIGWFDLAQARAVLDIDSLVVIGRAYASGSFLPHDPDLALRWFERAAQLGNPAAMRELGLWYLSRDALSPDAGGLRQNAELWLSRAVALGDVPAMEDLADAYNRGLFRPPSPDQAYRLHLLAAHRGSLSAKLHVAQVLIERNGTAREADEALAWLKEAGEGGSAEAMNAVGEMLLARADAASAQEGLTWLHRAAEAGHRAALFRLGGIYEAGSIVSQDLDRAAALYQAAASAGHLEAVIAQFNLRERTAVTQ